MEKVNFSVQLPAFSDSVFYISDFGAVEGGKVSNTAAIQSTIDAAANLGGGHVVIPPGIWLTGPIILKSNIDLHLQTGAVLLFDKNPEEYTLHVTEYEGMRRIRAKSPISATGASNIGITGCGIIDGNGHLWRMAKQFKFTERQWNKMKQFSPDTIQMSQEGEVWFPTKSAFEGFLHGEPNLASMSEKEALELAAPYYDFYRPVMVSLIRCEKILIEGLTFQNSPAWNIHPVFCRHFTMRDAFVRNDYFAQNGDGLDLESCRYAEIARVCFDVGDDAICIKSGKNAAARKIPIPTEDVYIHDCTVYHGHSGFSIGSEMSRGVRRVLVERCTFIGTDIGIRFKSAMGRGGIVEDIMIRQINMIRIQKEAVLFTLGYQLYTNGLFFVEEGATFQKEDIPEIRNIQLLNLNCIGAEYGIRILGLEERPVHHLLFQDCSFSADQAWEISHGSDILFRRLSFRLGKDYPEQYYEDQQMV